MRNVVVYHYLILPGLDGCSPTDRLRIILRQQLLLVKLAQDGDFA